MIGSKYLEVFNDIVFFNLKFLNPKYNGYYYHAPSKQVFSAKTNGDGTWAKYKNENPKTLYKLQGKIDSSKYQNVDVDEDFLTTSHSKTNMPLHRWMSIEKDKEYSLARIYTFASWSRQNPFSLKVSQSEIAFQVLQFCDSIPGLSDLLRCKSRQELKAKLNIEYGKVGEDKIVSTDKVVTSYNPNNCKPTKKAMIAKIGAGGSYTLCDNSIYTGDFQIEQAMLKYAKLNPNHTIVEMIMGNSVKSSILLVWN